MRCHYLIIHQKDLKLLLSVLQDRHLKTEYMIEPLVKVWFEYEYDTEFSYAMGYTDALQDMHLNDKGE